MFRFPTRTSLRVGTFVCAAALAASGTVPAAWSTSAPTGPRPLLLPARDDDDDSVPRRWRHSSDGVKGEIAAPMPGFRRGTPRTTRIRSWRPTRGLKVSEWNERTKRGPVRLQLLTVTLGTRGLRVGYGNAGTVHRTQPLGKILARHRAIAGVNGDFFDISSTGAPLGLGASHRRGLLNARERGWNKAFFKDAKGRWRIDELTMKARIMQRPKWPVATFNSHRVRPGTIGIYTSKWGRTSGYRVTGGQRNSVRHVLVRNGRVVQTRKKLNSGERIRGTLLIGRGDGARKLSRLRKGSRVTVRRWVAGKPKIAITGNVFLIRDGVVKAIDDREMHPRTAVGIDRDARQLLFLVVDGRQKFSRGYTMVELAHTMARLGADEALNLDGGGSSTMIAKKPGGRIGLVNQPSDGRQRSIPNGLEIIRRR